MKWQQAHTQGKDNSVVGSVAAPQMHRALPDKHRINFLQKKQWHDKRCRIEQMQPRRKLLLKIGRSLLKPAFPGRYSLESASFPSAEKRCRKFDLYLSLAQGSSHPMACWKGQGHWRMYSYFPWRIAIKATGNVELSSSQQIVG